MAGVMFRAKKKLASASLNTQAGRTAVIAFVGEEGGRVLDALKGAITKDTNAKEAKDKKKDILKIAVKFKMMADKKKLTLENTKHLQTPLNNLCIEVVDYFGPPPHGRALTDDDRKKMTASLSLSFGHVARLLDDTVKEHLKPKNLAKLQGLFTFFGNPAFLAKVRDEPSLAEERKIIFESLETMLLSAGIVHVPMESVKMCIVTQCDKTAALPWTDGRIKFPGSEMCINHHFLKYFPLLRDPDFNVWLTTEELRNIMRPWLNLQGEEKSLTFIVTVDQYSTLTNPSVRRQRAQVIASKYIEGKEGLALDHITLKAITDGLATPETHAMSKYVFQPARDLIFKRLSSIFNDRFVHTLAYQEWEAGVSLPEHINSDLRKKYEEMIRKMDEESKRDRTRESKVDTTPTSTGLAAAQAAISPRSAGAAAAATALSTSSTSGASPAKTATSTTSSGAATVSATNPPPPPFPAHLIAEANARK